MFEYENPQAFSEYVTHFFENVAPALAKAFCVITIVPAGRPSMRVALEVGTAVLLDKPLVLVVADGADVPKLLDGLAYARIDLPDPRDDWQKVVGPRLTEVFDRMRADGILPPPQPVESKS